MTAVASQIDLVIGSLPRAAPPQMEGSSSDNITSEMAPLCDIDGKLQQEVKHN
jgi:hypothetical protein